MSKKKATDPIGIEWPTYKHRWWWMRWRPTPKSEWRLTVVEFGSECVRFLESQSWVSRRTCEQWEVSFSPAGMPPKEWCS